MRAVVFDGPGTVPFVTFPIRSRAQVRSGCARC